MRLSECLGSCCVLSTDMVEIPSSKVTSREVIVLLDVGKKHDSYYRDRIPPNFQQLLVR